MPRIPQALEIGTASAAESKATRDASVRLNSAVMWLRTLATMVTTRADRHRRSLLLASEDPAHIEAADLIGISPGTLLTYIDRLESAFDEPPKKAAKRKPKTAK
jgi:hypothetical protein